MYELSLGLQGLISFMFCFGFFSATLELTEYKRAKCMFN